jgi:hypothetical protein
MALKTTYEIRCSCGKKFTGDIYEYVFAEYDPELKDMILSGEFNRIPCPSCDQRLHIENTFLYRDEKNKLWVWVCKKEEEPRRDELAEDLIEKNTSMEFHYLEDRESYKKFLVFGREGLLELLLKEDPALKRREGRRLKTNPALRLVLKGNKEPGYLFLRGEKIRISLPLRFSEAHQNLVNGPEGKMRWLQYYAQGLNVHNPYSSFLDRRLRLKWNRIREKEPLSEADNEFDDFAESWAGYRIDSKRIKARYPERRGFLEELRKRNISRRVRSLDTRLIPRESA